MCLLDDDEDENDEVSAASRAAAPPSPADTAMAAELTAAAAAATAVIDDDDSDDDESDDDEVVVESSDDESLDQDRTVEARMHAERTLSPPTLLIAARTQAPGAEPAPPLGVVSYPQGRVHEITPESITIAFPSRLAERLTQFTGHLVMVERMPGERRAAGLSLITLRRTQCGRHENTCSSSDPPGALAPPTPQMPSRTRGRGRPSRS